MLQNRKGVYDSVEIREWYGCTPFTCPNNEHREYCLFKMFVLPLIREYKRREAISEGFKADSERKRIAQKRAKEERDAKRKGLGWMKL